MKKSKNKTNINPSNFNTLGHLFKEIYEDEVSTLLFEVEVQKCYKERLRKEKFKKDIDKKIEDLLK